MLISVIVPVYKVEKYIYRCVESILNQTFSDFELILVDDGSPDNCGMICDEYKKKDNRIHVIHKENGGLSDARNAGIDWAFANSNSEWITFIDSDDWIHPIYLEALFNAVSETSCNIGICTHKNIEKEELIIEQFEQDTKVYKTEDFFCNYNGDAITAWAKLYKKTLFFDIRYPKGRIHEDQYTTPLVLFKNETCVFVNLPLYYYYQNPDSITQVEWNPKRMDAIEALIIQSKFFCDNHFEKAYKTSLHNLLWVMSSYVNSLEVSKTYNNNKKIIRRLLKKYIKKTKSELDLSFRDNSFYYEAAYPICMKIYWNYSGIVSHFKKRIKNY